MENATVTENQPKKRGRPSTGKAMTPAERQRASRKNRINERYESFPPICFSVLFSAEASMALGMLTFKSDMSQKEQIEKLLIDAYRKSLEVI